MKRITALPIVCYVLLVAAWVIDLLTPQPLIAAILLNVPIALSGLALSGRLTSTLVISAEFANAMAGYMNGVQAGHRWDSIAIENRTLCAGSFILVGYLTTIAQRYALQEGRVQERTRALARERRLRKALEAVRETLNTDVVVRAIVREAGPLLSAREAVLIRVCDVTHEPQWYTCESDVGAVEVRSKRLDGNLNAMVSGIPAQSAIELDPSYPVAADVLQQFDAHYALATRLAVAGETLFLFALYDATPDAGERGLLQSYAEGAAVALAQASLYGNVAARAL